MQNVSYAGLGNSPSPSPADERAQVGASSDTNLARSSIEGLQKELAEQIAILTDKLLLVLRPDCANKIETAVQQPPMSTPTHGWLRDQGDKLHKHLDALRSLNERLEV